MRKLKVKLADENVYTLSTLTLRQQMAARKFERLSDVEMKEMDELTTKTKLDAELSPADDEKLSVLQEKQMRGLLKIVALSLAKNHNEFKITDPASEPAVVDKVQDLIDLRDLRRFASFAMIGTLPVASESEDGMDVEDVIDLTIMDEPQKA